MGGRQFKVSSVNLFLCSAHLLVRSNGGLQGDEKGRAPGCKEPGFSCQPTGLTVSNK